MQGASRAAEQCKLRAGRMSIGLHLSAINESAALTANGRPATGNAGQLQTRLTNREGCEGSPVTSAANQHRAALQQCCMQPHQVSPCLHDVAVCWQVWQVLQVISGHQEEPHASSCALLGCQQDGEVSITVEGNIDDLLPGWWLQEGAGYLQHHELDM